MSVFFDKTAYYFDIQACLYRGEAIWLCCPECQQLAKLYKRDEQLYVQCESCSLHKNYRKQCAVSVFSQGNCEHCARHFNVAIDEKNAVFSKFNISCPHCQQLTQGKVKVNQQHWYYRRQAKRDGRDPYFELPFYLMTELAPNQPLWALNPAHLQYLMEYVAADLRQKSNLSLHRSASHSLPLYIKLRKNRERVLTKLHQLQTLVLA